MEHAEGTAPTSHRVAICSQASWWRAWFGEQDSNLYSAGQSHASYR